MPNYNPDPTLEAEAAQNDFVLWSFQRYHQLEVLETYSPYFRNLYGDRPRENPRRHYAHIEELYFLGSRVYQVLYCSFEEFKNALLYREGVYPDYRDYERRRQTTTPWYDRHGVYFRQRQGYTKPSQPKTKINPSPQAAWREHKGLTRDYRRRNRGERSRAKKHAKHYSNRMHRQIEREFIRQEKWDNFSSTIPKDLYDPWMWD